MNLCPTHLLVFKKDIETDENALIIFYVKQKQIQYNFF